MDEFYQQHFEECEYCYEVDQNPSLTSNQKLDLIGDHTINAMAGLGDILYEASKD